MNAILDSFGTKLTERIITAVALPGLVYVALCGWMLASGHGRLLDVPYVAAEADRAWSSVSGTRAGPAIAIALVLGTSVAVGLVVAALGQGIHRLYIVRLAWDDLDQSRMPRRGTAWWIKWRRKRFWGANRKRGFAPPRNYEPHCVTSIGDAFRLIGTRIDVQYGLAVNAAWPRLMLLTGADGRTPVDVAYRRYQSGTSLAGWSLVLLPWAFVSWPAAVVGAVGITVAFWRAKGSAAALAAIIEAVFDVHQAQLAASVGVELLHGRLTRYEGNHITDILTKRAQAPAPPQESSSIVAGSESSRGRV